MVIVNGGLCFFYDWVQINNKKISCHQTNTFTKRGSWNLKINEVMTLVALSIFFHDWVQIYWNVTTWTLSQNTWRSLEFTSWNFKINKATIFVALSTRTSLTLKCTQKMIHTRWVTYSHYDENVCPLKKYLDLIWQKRQSFKIDEDTALVGTLQNVPHIYIILA
jgi:hypothetical protein